MFNYIIRRVFQSILVLLVVGLVAFSMFRFVGDPIDNMLGQERTQADIERLRAQLGLDQPFPVQYWKFLSNAAEGNFGVSYRQKSADGSKLKRRGQPFRNYLCNRPSLAITYTEISLGSV